ncbi:longitudinals lacking protein, isoforms H/M/V isoform X1 [Coccinella septempunctata]|uniref:longitudinals lacking protein, isoforms H/M/V isoform X1 n=1 Tax=Coccinella septempunctata TaxID=41139 RepID=UPI001D070232|nr:longitudinals lacking protein, isoforms H/M/V isoform X1 [Coccinella septempunctata]
MEDDQQFCLRWNNHQSTLVSVFDTLLESGTLVDCTLAAEGKYLNAHKVVLSACSPYFESLLSKHYDKHPILILKDVKFQELKAMMDYMYRGEVNISQDQLGALLKAAESLQIKGLSDNRKGGDVKPAAPIQPKSPQPASTIPKVQGLTIEQRTRDDSREGSQSPGPRKKKRIRRKSEDLDNHDVHSNSSESHSNHGPTAQNIPLPAPSKLAADVPEPLETKSEIILRHKPSDEMIPQVPIKEKIETHTELMLEPKSEYVEEMNEDSIEDLTLDDDDMSNMEHMGDGAGPSHGNMGEGSSQGFGSWHLGNQSQDEVFLAAQEAVGAHRDSQGSSEVTDILATLPEKSRDQYEKEYRMFSGWCITNHYEKITEVVLLNYFQEKAKTLKSTTLFTRYCMLKSVLAMTNGIDISKYTSLLKFLRDTKQGYIAVKKSETLSRDQMNLFIRDAPDDVYLMMKVALIFGVAGSMSRIELSYITIDDIEDSGSTISFTINDPDSLFPRVARIIDEGEDTLNYAYYYRKYAALRPIHTAHRRFFVNYRDGKCSANVVGQNTFGKIPSAVAKFLNLPNPKMYTGYCFKSTCKSLTMGMEKLNTNSFSSVFGLRH